jgi:hypothetical protein
MLVYAAPSGDTRSLTLLVGDIRWGSMVEVGKASWDARDPW